MPTKQVIRNRSIICIHKTLAMKGLPVDQEQLVWRWTILRAVGLRATATAGNAAKLTEKELPPAPSDPPCSYNLWAVSLGVGLPSTWVVRSHANG